MLRPMAGVGDLGIGVKVKVPKEIKTAAAQMPEFSETMKKLTSVMDAGNVTVQVVAVGALFGALVAILLWKRQ